MTVENKLPIEPGKIPWVQITIHLIPYLGYYVPLDPESSALVADLSQALRDSTSRNDIKEGMVLATSGNTAISSPISKALAVSLDTLGWPDNFQAARALINHAPTMVFNADGIERNPVAVMASKKLIEGIEREEIIENKAVELKNKYGITYDIDVNTIEADYDPKIIRNRISTADPVSREDLRQICINLLNPDVGHASQAAGLFETEILLIRDPLERYLVLSQVERASEILLEQGWVEHEVVRSVLNKLEDIVLDEIAPRENEFNTYLENHKLSPKEK